MRSLARGQYMDLSLNLFGTDRQLPGYERERKYRAGRVIEFAGSRVAGICSRQA